MGKNRLLKHIPNTITCLNLFSGCMACLAAFSHNYKSAFLWIFAGAIFDFCDGYFARFLNYFSPIGKELDSLADLITFGLAPSLLCVSMLMEFTHLFSGIMSEILPLFGFLIVIFSALRLAKFNIDTKQSNSFIGLPVPANALFWCGIAAISQHIVLKESYYMWILLFLIFLFSFLMISKLPMFSLKIKNLKWAENKICFIFLIGSIFFLLLLGVSGLTVVIVWYLLLSILTKKS